MNQQYYINVYRAQLLFITPITILMAAILTVTLLFYHKLGMEFLRPISLLSLLWVCAPFGILWMLEHRLPRAITDYLYSVDTKVTDLINPLRLPARFCIFAIGSCTCWPVIVAGSLIHLSNQRKLNRNQ